MSNRRFTTHFAANPQARGLAPDHRAVVEGRTLFPTMVMPAEDSPLLLVSGTQQRKIGGRVVKGRWRGMPIFTVTLEERATCPRTCHHWLTCYGNTTPFSRRHAAGPALESRLAAELAEKQKLHQRGFVVRLHVLGDFYDEAYVMLWRRWLAQFSALRVFGYTARDPGSTIGALVGSLNADFGDRAWLRFSAPRALPGVISAVTVQSRDTPIEAIICPAQTDQTDCCATCGLCWTTERPIAFLLHGGFSGGRARAAAAPRDEPAVAPDVASAAPPAFRGSARWTFAPPQPPAPPALARTIEDIRTWLAAIIGPAAAEMGPRALLSVANHHRRSRGLAAFRLVSAPRQIAGCDT